MHSKQLFLGIYPFSTLPYRNLTDHVLLIPKSEPYNCYRNVLGAKLLLQTSVQWVLHSSPKMQLVFDF